jgi:SAM-dependent methyltransferase
VAVFESTARGDNPCGDGRPKQRGGDLLEAIMSAAVTGAAYVEAMNRDPTDREYRRAFLSVALALVPPQGSVFDFGSGPGIDAKQYADAGLRVRAYDSDAAMCEYFARHCAAEIAAGSVRLDTRTYPDFLRFRAGTNDAAVDLIVANFAPLNLVADLPPLFAKFSAMLKPQGKLLVSVLNPFFRGLLKSRRWWAQLPRLLWQGRYTTRLHGSIPVTRWLPGRLARQAAPLFELTSIYAPETAPAGRPPRQVTFSRSGEWPQIAATQFLFLQFQRKTGI